jgi:hypothetical protein
VSLTVVRSCTVCCNRACTSASTRESIACKHSSVRCMNGVTKYVHKHRVLQKAQGASDKHNDTLLGVYIATSAAAVSAIAHSHMGNSTNTQIGSTVHNRTKTSTSTYRKQTTGSTCFGCSHVTLLVSQVVTSHRTCCTAESFSSFSCTAASTASCTNAAKSPVGSNEALFAPTLPF